MFAVIGRRLPSGFSALEELGLTEELLVAELEELGLTEELLVAEMEELGLTEELLDAEIPAWLLEVVIMRDTDT